MTKFKVGQIYQYFASDDDDVSVPTHQSIIEIIDINGSAWGTPMIKYKINHGDVPLGYNGSYVFFEDSDMAKQLIEIEKPHDMDELEMMLREADIKSYNKEPVKVDKISQYNKLMEDIAKVEMDKWFGKEEIKNHLSSFKPRSRKITLITKKVKPSQYK